MPIQSKNFHFLGENIDRRYLRLIYMSNSNSNVVFTFLSIKTKVQVIELI